MLDERGGGWAQGSGVPLRATLLAFHYLLRLCRAESEDFGLSGEREGWVWGREEGSAARRVGRLSRGGARRGHPASSASGFGDVLG